MRSKYVATKTAYLFEDTASQNRSMVLIFGDEVDVHTEQPPANGRVAVTYRGRGGFMKEDALRDDAVLETYFIDVGQGDSTFIVTPKRHNILVDGGINRRALGFLTWKYRLDEPANRLTIDLLVLTHPDADHMNGLVPILSHPRIDVGEIIHCGVATYDLPGIQAIGGVEFGGAKHVTRHDGLNQLNPACLSSSFAAWKQAIEAKGISYHAVDGGTGVVFQEPRTTFTALAPRVEASGHLPWFDDESATVNGNSVVLRLQCDDVAFLLAGDLNGAAERYLLTDPTFRTRCDAHVLKAPHHGSHDFAPAFLQAVRPQITVVSSGNEPDHGHPRAIYLGAVGAAARSERPLLFATEIAATFQEAQPEPSPTAPNLNSIADPATPEGSRDARLLFKRRLSGMINVRTDGSVLYAARRVAASYWWESYGPLAPAEGF